MCRFFNQICENKLEHCRKFWNLWKLFNIIQNYSIVSLTLNVVNWAKSSEVTVASDSRRRWLSSISCCCWGLKLLWMVLSMTYFLALMSRFELKTLFPAGGHLLRQYSLISSSQISSHESKKNQSMSEEDYHMVIFSVCQPLFRTFPNHIRWCVSLWCLRGISGMCK